MFEKIDISKKETVEANQESSEKDLPVWANNKEDLYFAYEDKDLDILLDEFTTKIDNELSKIDKILDGFQNDNPSTKLEIRLTPLIEGEKKQIQKETGWSNEIIDNIKTKEEAKIYKIADLKETKVGDKTCLIRSDYSIDEVVDEMTGETNLDRMKKGKAPLDRDGKPIELHHIGQRNDSPLAELTGKEHRSGGNDTILHDKTKESEINRTEFKKEKEEHWKARAEQIESERSME